MGNFFGKSIFKSFVAITMLAVFLIGVQPIQANSNSQSENAEATLKHETLFANLDYDGSVLDIFAVNTFFTNDNHIVDFGDYSEIINLTDASNASVDEDKIVFSNDASNSIFRYQGRLRSTSLPWNFNITYYLDDEEINPTELGGRSGSLAINIELAYDESAHDYFLDNFLLQIRVPLEMDKSFNITAKDAQILNVGNTATVAFTLLPKTSNVFTVKADVVDFTMGSIEVAAIKSVIPAVENIDEFQTGFGEMADGTRELIEGTETLKDGMVELSSGVNSLANGTSGLSRGLNTLNAGMGDFAAGLEEYRGGKEQIAAGARGFEDGLKQIATSLPQLNEGYQGIELGLDAMMANSEDVSALAMSLSQSEDPQVRMLAQAMLQKIGGISQLQNGLKNANDGLEATTTAIETMSSQFSIFSSGIEQSVDGIKEIESGFGEIKTGSSGLASGLNNLRRGMNDLDENVKNLPSDIEKLVEGQVALYEGIVTAKSEIEGLLGEDEKADPVSFVSPLKGRVQSVQFILRTPAISVEVIEETETTIEASITIWDRFINLFRDLANRFFS